MSFSQGSKSRMFVRSARICCLCFKQCGTNIEVAHIIAAADGGLDEDENGIPVCLDCHQEIGAYDNRHPRGNKFGPEELKTRRDNLYRLVETGAIQARLIASRLHERGLALGNSELERGKPSEEATAVLAAATASWPAIESLPHKLALLDGTDRAYVLDQLAGIAVDGDAMESFMGILSSDVVKDERVVMLERLVRKLTIAGTADAKAAFMQAVPIDPLKEVNVDLLESFFLGLMETMRRDQYQEVNLVTPAIIRVQEAIPESLTEQYVVALVRQAASGAWQGAPSAGKALTLGSQKWAKLVYRELTGERVHAYQESDHLRAFVRATQEFWPEAERALLRDFSSLDHFKFMAKHYWHEQPEA